MAGAIVSQYLFPSFSIALHFYLHKCPVKDYFFQLPTWLVMVTQLGFGQVIQIEVIYETSLKSSKAVPPPAVSFCIY